MTKRPGPPIIDEPDLPSVLIEAGTIDLGLHTSLDDMLITAAQAVDDAIEDVTLSGCRLENVVLTGSRLRKVSLVDVTFTDCELSGTTCDFAMFQRVRFERCRMSGFVAPQLAAHHVTFDECRMDQAWLRMSTLERCAFDDCDLTAADFYSATITESRFVRSHLDEVELTDAVLREVAFHKSTVDGIKGAASLRDITIGSDQIVPFALPVFGALGIAVDDDYFHSNWPSV